MRASNTAKSMLQSTLNFGQRPRSSPPPSPRTLRSLRCHKRKAVPVVESSDGEGESGEPEEGVSKLNGEVGAAPDGHGAVTSLSQAHSDKSRKIKAGWLLDHKFLEVGSDPVTGKDHLLCSPCSLSRGRPYVMQHRISNIKRHAEGDAHVEAAAAFPDQKYQAAGKANIRTLFEQQEAVAPQLKKKLFQVVYFLQSKGSPMTHYGPMVEFLRDMETPDISRAHATTRVGWEMAESCSAVELDELIARLKKDGCMFAITVDTSEARGHVDYLDIEIRISGDDYVGVSYFGGLVEVGTNTDAAGQAELVLRFLIDVLKLTPEEICLKLVGFASDGAMVMVGHLSGLAQRLKELLSPRMVSTHCAAHRANLVGEKLGKDATFVKLLTFLQAIYNYFNGSPKRIAGLESSARIPGVQLYAIQAAGDTRWLSNRIALDSILKNLGPLMERLEQIGMRDHEADAASLFGELTEVETLLSMYMAEPLLDCLGILCKTLQVAVEETKAALKDLYEGDTSYSGDAWVKFNAFVKATEESVEGPWVLDADGDLNFTYHDTLAEEHLNIPLTCTSRTGLRGRPVIMDASPALVTAASEKMQEKFAAASMSTRLDLGVRFPELALFNALSIVHPKLHRTLEAKELPALVKALKAHYCGRMLFADGRLSPPLLNGDLLDEQLEAFTSIMKSLCGRANTVAELWQHIDHTSDGRRVTEYAKLARLYATLPSGSVDNERSFSIMNIVKNALRNRLGTPHLNASMRNFRSSYTYLTFPYEEVYAHFIARKERRMMDI